MSHDVVPHSVIGIIANPMSGRDIRRLVAHASVFPNSEKTNMIRRLLAAAGALGVERALISTDGMGVAAGLVRALAGRQTSRLPTVEFVELDEFTESAQDTTQLVRLMVARGAGAIVILGGDGTVRAAATASDDVPLLPLSTGTNNTFPQLWEATVAGMAASLVATDRAAAGSSSRAKVLKVQRFSGEEVVQQIALVDVCVATVTHVGSKALWKPETFREIFCTFAEPHAIGLSSIAGLTHPVMRTDPFGVHVSMNSAMPSRLVTAPIAPGVIAPISVETVDRLEFDSPRSVQLSQGTIALDGERELEFGPEHRLTVTLAMDGPVVIDVHATLAGAADTGLLAPAFPSQRHPVPTAHRSALEV